KGMETSSNANSVMAFVSSKCSESSPAAKDASKGTANKDHARAFTGYVSIIKLIPYQAQCENFGIVEMQPQQIFSRGQILQFAVFPGNRTAQRICCQRNRIILCEASQPVTVFIKNLHADGAFAGITIEQNLVDPCQVDRFECDLADVVKRFFQRGLPTHSHRADSGESIQRNGGKTDAALLAGIREVRPASNRTAVI